MKRALHIMNTREKKDIFKALEKQFGYKKKLEQTFLQASKNRIYIIARDFEQLDLSKFNIDKLGMYFGEFRNNEIRLSLEGCQLIGPDAKTNIVKIDKTLLESWLKGENLHLKTDMNGFVLLKYEKDFIGCGRARDEDIINFVPKTRRIKEIAN